MSFKIKNIFRNLIMRFFYLTRKRNENVVFFSSFGGKQYSDNPRAVSECLHSIAPDIKIVWTIMDNKKNLLPDYVTCVSPSSIDSLKAQARAKVWIFNCVLQEGTYKGKSTLYIQTWHGDRGFKKMALDAYRAMGDNYKGAKHYIENDICDYFVVGSQFGETTNRSAFAYEGKMIKSGCPRNDRLLNGSQDHSCELIKGELAIRSDSKILLYAPTFRDGLSEKQNEQVDLTRALNVLEKNGEHWTCLMRAHSLSKGIDIDGVVDSRIIDATDYPDMADLLLIADCLVTDYSSSAQDFILRKKPVVLAQFDYEDFTSNRRQLYHRQDEIGFLIAHNQSEFEDILLKLNSFDHGAIADRVNAFYGVYETGRASETVCKYITDWCKSV